MKKTSNSTHESLMRLFNNVNKTSEDIVMEYWKQRY